MRGPCAASVRMEAARRVYNGLTKRCDFGPEMLRRTRSRAPTRLTIVSKRRIFARHNNIAR